MEKKQLAARAEGIMRRGGLLGAAISKKTLYLLCFMALNLIEFLRASQTGDIWHVAVNCTGFVVMIMIASAYPLKEFCTIPNGIYTVACVAAMAASRIFSLAAACGRISSMASRDGHYQHLVDRYHSETFVQKDSGG